MYQFLLIVHIVVAVLMVTFILLQQGKGAAAGASFGSGASNTVFGSQGSAGFMSRITWVLVACFFSVNLGLSYLSNQSLKASSIEELKRSVVLPSDDIPEDTNSSDIPGE